MLLSKERGGEEREKGREGRKGVGGREKEREKYREGGAKEDNEV